MELRQSTRNRRARCYRHKGKGPRLYEKHWVWFRLGGRQQFETGSNGGSGSVSWPLSNPKSFPFFDDSTNDNECSLTASVVIA